MENNEDPKGVWFKQLYGREHWHTYLGNGRYAAISRCGNKYQNAEKVVLWARASGVHIAGAPMCKRCIALVAKDSEG